MLIVTGGAGFIGSNLVQALNEQGRTDILVVDRLGENFRNLCDLRISDFIQPEEFFEMLHREAFTQSIEAIFHQGACADTTCTDGKFMIDNNVAFSKALFHFAIERRIPLVYASSAATYGASTNFREAQENERPLNLYGLSKLIFDNYVRAHLSTVSSTVVGLRYFNVYGPREAHKGPMASMVFQLYNQLQKDGKAHLFEGSGGYVAGDQQRDFVSVRDVVRVNLHFAASAVCKGIFNCGTGDARSFNSIARELIRHLGKGEISYIPFAPGLREKYQSFTQADLTALRAAGYTAGFSSLEDGIANAVQQWQLL